MLPLAARQGNAAFADPSRSLRAVCIVMRVSGARHRFHLRAAGPALPQAMFSAALRSKGPPPADQGHERRKDCDSISADRGRPSESCRESGRKTKINSPGVCPSRRPRPT